MKISPRTLTVLKNFAKIAPSITIDALDTTLKTLAPAKTILGWAVGMDQFPVKFSIFNLDRFISAMSLFEDPELTFNDRYVTITGSGGRSVDYVYAEESTILQAPKERLKLPETVVSFTLPWEDYKGVEKAHAVLGLPNIMIKGDGKDITIQSVDIKNSSGDSYKVTLGKTDKKFKVVFKYENLKMLPSDYDVTICKGISHFVTKDKDLEYYIAVEDKSVYS
jgi:hypothetical protein